MGKWIEQEIKAGRLASSDVDFQPLSFTLLPGVELVIRKIHEDVELKAFFSVLPRIGDLIQVHNAESGDDNRFTVRNIVYECSDHDSTTWVMDRVVINVENA